jgi:hypothetical protein
VYKNGIYKEKAQKSGQISKKEGKETISQRTLHICKTGVSVRRHGPDVERGRRYSRSTLVAISAAENNQLYK